MRIWGWIHADGGGFGDRWAAVNYILQQGQTNYFSVQCPQALQARRILRALRTDSVLLPSPLPPNARPAICEAFSRPWLQTRVAWSPQVDPRLVTFQFDGRSFADRKNLTPQEEQFLQIILLNLGYRLENVGGMRPLRNIIRLLARSTFFVGVCSGVSHIARSVGTPSFVISNRLAYHRELRYTYRHGAKVCRTYREFFAEINGRNGVRVIEASPHHWVLERQEHDRWQRFHHVQF